MRKNFKTKHAYRIDAKGFCRAGLWYKFEETEVEKDEANTEICTRFFSEASMICLELLCKINADTSPMVTRNKAKYPSAFFAASENLVFKSDYIKVKGEFFIL